MSAIPGQFGAPFSPFSVEHGDGGGSRGAGGDAGSVCDDALCARGGSVGVGAGAKVGGRVSALTSGGGDNVKFGGKIP